MAGNLIVLKRATFVKFFSNYFKVEESRADYFFSCWAIFLTHAEVRAASNNNIKDALAVHISDVVNNSKLLLSKPLGKAQNYKQFVEMITPALYEGMKRDFSYIDDAILEHENERKQRPGRRSEIDSVSIDLSLNSEKPTYERGGELLNEAGMAIDRRLFLTGNFLSGVGTSISDWWSGSVKGTKEELGISQRDRAVIVPKMEGDVAPGAKQTSSVPTSSATPKANPANTTNYTDPVFRELVDSGTIQETNNVKSTLRPGTANGGKIDVQFERERQPNAKSTSDSLRLTDSEYPVLEFLMQRSQN